VVRLTDLGFVAAEATRHRHFLWLEIDAKHATALCLLEAHGDPSNQSETDHYDTLAQRRSRDPHPLKCDSSNARLRRGLERHAVRTPRAKAPADCHQASVRTRSCNTIAGLEVVNSIARLEDDAGSRIAERHRLAELAAHLGNGRRQSFLPDLFDHATN